MKAGINRKTVIVHLAAFAGLAFAALIIDIARDAPRVLPAFNQRYFYVLLSLLVLTLPLTVWQCRHRISDLKVVLSAYGVAAGVVIMEMCFSPSLFDGGASKTMFSLIAIGASYAVLQVCIVRLIGKRLWFAAMAFLLFAGTGIADLYSSNRYHGSIHWVLEWTVWE